MHIGCESRVLCFTFHRNYSVNKVVKVKHSPFTAHRSLFTLKK
ncbi:hypothetical protein EVA_01439 [gut metagenome]|uniref:Uncharacterized protein n=1 Tax=gut metagenome TaxID=749906 RepID=J9GPZ6_9ZZZZ